MIRSKVRNRLILAGAAALAAAAIAAPTALGLMGNSSFRRDITVPVPSGAHPVQFSEPQPSGSRSKEDHPGHESESNDAGDDHGGLRHDATDDHGGLRVSGSDDPTGDRHGGTGSDAPTGDRHGGRGDG